MSWNDWMTSKLTIEEELRLEKQVRQVEKCTDLDTLQSLCAAMTRQNYHYQQLLKQAVLEMAEMDAKLTCAASLLYGE